MDGVLLVFDSRALPNLHALAPVDAALAPRQSHWRHRTFPAVAALILATVFSLVYFVATHSTVPSPAPITGASVTAPLANPAAPSNSPDANQTQPTPAAEANVAATETSEPKRQETTVKAAATTLPPPAKKASAAKSSTQPKPAEEPKKDDSKVGSILKKTGRILKKPFKL
jgi:outer membrane biosynthesis protein TonB